MDRVYSNKRLSPAYYLNLFRASRTHWRIATQEVGWSKTRQGARGRSSREEAARQGSLISPLTKKGSISLYSRIFTVASFGALPCAIARNACSDWATIARARSFLWIEWYLDGMAQCSSGMT